MQVNTTNQQITTETRQPWQLLKQNYEHHHFCCNGYIYISINLDQPVLLRLSSFTGSGSQIFWYSLFAGENAFPVTK